MIKRVRLKDIAEKAGVSVALVSYVMSESEHQDGRPSKYRVNINTRKRILNIAKEMGYTPYAAARTLRGGNSKVVGVILNDISNPFYGGIARYLEDAAHKEGYTILIGNTDEDAEKFSYIVQSFISKGVDGMIVFPCRGCEKDMQLIESMKIPVVVVDRHDIKINAPTIILDGRDAIKKAVDWLRNKGIEDIEMLSYSVRMSSITDREEAFIDIIGKDKAKIHFMDFHNPEKDASVILPDLVKRGVKGLVTTTGAVCMPFIKEMFEQNMRPGIDISIVGFDKESIYSINPHIPHVVQPLKQMCEVSFNYLQDIIEGRATQTYSLTVFDGTLCQ